MTPLRPIDEITNRDIQQAVRESLTNGFHPERVGRFLALIDWSRGGGPDVRASLGVLTGWADEYAEEELSDLEYARRLLDVLQSHSLLHSGLGPVCASGAFREVLTGDAPYPPGPRLLVPPLPPRQN